MELHSQIASILEALANAAVAEICKLVDDGSALLHLELSQNQKEKEYLKRKVKLLELQVARYRGSRGRNPDAFPGVRLLGRQQHDGATGTLGPTRNKFLNRTQGDQSLSKASPINLDQDPDQEVVTTTKTESQDPEQRDEDLLIVKVEGAMDTSQLPAETSRDGTAPSEGPKEHMPSGQHNQTEVSGSDIIPIVVDQSVADHGSIQSTLTGSAVKAEKEVLGEHFLNKTLQRVWADMLANDDVSPPCENLKNLESQTPGQPSKDVVRGNCSASLTSNSCLPYGGSGQLETIVIGGATSDQQGAVEHTRLGRTDLAGGRELMEKRRTGVTEQVTGSPSELDTSASQSSDCPPTQIKHTAPPSDSIMQIQIANHAMPACLKAPHNINCISQELLTHPTGQRSGQNKAPIPRHRPSPYMPLERPYGCSSCTKRYYLEADLLRHQRRHSRGKPYSCQLCGKSFVCQSQLDIHRNVHTGEKPFSCSVCSRQFSHPSNLKRHQKVQH